MGRYRTYLTNQNFAKPKTFQNFQQGLNFKQTFEANFCFAMRGEGVGYTFSI